EAAAEGGPEAIPDSSASAEPALDGPAGPTTAEENAEGGRFKEGQMLTFVRVRFPGQAKALPFFIGNRRFAYGQAVVAMSERGMAVGHINSFPYQRPFNKSMLPIHSISKLAAKEDLAQMGRSTPEEKHAEEVCNKLIEKHQLNMVLTHVEFVQYGKKTVFYFNAPGRVDFRNLVKDLVAELKTRIELRQITVRDRAAAIGAVGPCGLGTCCSTFLESYGNVSIKMAKNQDLTLLPGKLNGPCGQIKCCIRYENDVYTAKRQLLPKVGDLIATTGGDKGRVKGINILAEQFDLLTTEGKLRRYAANQYSPAQEKLTEDIFPAPILHLINETDHVIGLPESKPEVNEALPFAPLAPDETNEDEEDRDLLATSDDLSEASADPSSSDPENSLPPNDAGPLPPPNAEELAIELTADLAPRLDDDMDGEDEDHNDNDRDIDDDNDGPAAPVDAAATAPGNGADLHSPSSFRSDRSARPYPRSRHGRRHGRSRHRKGRR
ncbi:MAG: hypothetical protein J6Y94_09155, partial [Bacteriovoracaceae bacterium]|nr:hypothetical protein [Bacteriovoracaceae bacterium]